MTNEQRTCGNCNFSDHETLLCGLEYEDGSHDNITLDAPACIDWCKRYVSDEERIEQLEQRCHQLEQIAREMFKRAYEFNRDGSYFGGVYIADFREQLEALGVSLDD